MSDTKPAPPGGQRTKRIRRIAIAAVVLFLLAAVFSQVMQTSAFKRATTRQPEHFTELYFTSASQLPARVLAGGPLPVNFTVRNLEGTAQVYAYSLSFTDASGTTILGEYEEKLENGQTKQITRQITVPNGETRGMVSVSLAGKQSIHFWVERDL